MTDGNYLKTGLCMYVMNHGILSFFGLSGGSRAVCLGMIDALLISVVMNLCLYPLMER